MTRHLFRFGYRTPAQIAAKAEKGGDDEESGACFISAAGREEALVCGCAVAEAMVGRIFSSAGQPHYSWQAAGFAFWIEDDPAAVLEMELLETVPRIAAGTMPDLSRWDWFRTG